MKVSAIYETTISHRSHLNNNQRVWKVSQGRPPVNSNFRPRGGSLY